MPWLQIRLTIPRDLVPLVEAAAEEAGALAVTFADAADEPQLEPLPGATPLWQWTQVTSLFADDDDGRRRVAELAATLRRLTDRTAVVTRLADQIWERVWLERFRPTRFGRRLWVCPHGQPAPDPEAIAIVLDPGLAFGTGHHPTTALCLTWLDGHAEQLAGSTLIDYGCGSGILAIAAIRLGAARAFAVDHDPQALEATLANAAANGVAAQIEAMAPEDLPAVQVDLLLANILAAPLIRLAAGLGARLRPRGALVLSGILPDQVEAVAGAYAADFALDRPQILDGWALLSGRRYGVDQGVE